MKIITALKITIIFFLLFIIFKSSKEGLVCEKNYRYLHYPLKDKLMIKDNDGVVDCNNRNFEDYFN